MVNYSCNKFSPTTYPLASVRVTAKQTDGRTDRRRTTTMPILGYSTVT